MSLGITQYVSVTWTTGDVITEAKLDNMVANDQAYDSHAAQGILLNNDVGYYQKDVGGTNREIMNLDGADLLTLGDGTNEVATNTLAKASAYLSGDQSNITTSTFTKITLDTELYDIGSDFDTANNKFVAPVTGYYQVDGSVQMTTLTASYLGHLAVYVDGSQYGKLRGMSSGGAGGVGIIATGVVYMAAASYVELFAYSTEPSNVTDIRADGTWLSVHLLSV